MKIAQSIKKPIDVAHWQRDEEFAQYPEGARDKTLLRCPSPPPYSFLRGGHRYLFKRSPSWCPEEFWVEIFAYLLGIEMEIPVPVAFVAYDSEKNQSGALIEWFLNPITSLSEETHVSGGDYCQQYLPNFARKKGEQHNFQTLSNIFEDLTKKYPASKLNWKHYWTNIFVFDALIGNTDRHQDNWGTIIKPPQNGLISYETIRISPVFDNGTSMGREISSKKFKHYEDRNNLEKYVSNGCHHMKWDITDASSTGHLEMLKKIIDRYPDTHSLMLDGLKKVNGDTFKYILDTLVAFDVPIKLTPERAAFMLRLVQFRHQHLLHNLEK